MTRTRHRRLLGALLALTALALPAACTTHSQAKPMVTMTTGTKPPWSLRATDIGGGKQINTGGIGFFGDQSCYTEFGDLVSGQIGHGAPNDYAAYEAEGYQVRTQVVQLAGNNKNYRYTDYRPIEVLGIINHNIRLDIRDFAAKKRSKQVISIRGLGDYNATSISKTGTTTVGCSDLLAPPWNNGILDNPSSHLPGAATVWYQEQWFRLVDGKTIVALAIQGPTPISQRFDTATLLDVMTKRVKANPPSLEWKRANE